MEASELLSKQITTCRLLTISLVSGTSETYT